MAQLSLTEVSKRFNINRTTIYRAVNSGKLSRLSNGFFDIAEVIRVFGEPEPQKGSIQPPTINQNDREIISLLKSQVELLTKQLEKKDYQIDHLQRLLVAPETSKQRNNETNSNDAMSHVETPMSKEFDQSETMQETNSNDAQQHDATAQNEAMQQSKKRGLFNRLDRGIKAFLK